MKIICGTDLSAEACEVATLAGRIASSGNVPGSVTLAHVLERKSSRKRSAKLEGSAAESMEQRLEDEGRRLRALGTEVSIRLLEAKNGETLLDAEAREAADLIALPALSGGMQGDSRLGGACELILEHSSLPVLAVRDTARFMDWLEGARPLRILCIFDFTTSARRALGWVPRLAKRQACEIIVAYVTDTAAHAHDVGLDPQHPRDEQEATPEDLLRTEIAHKIDPLFGGLAYRIIISDHLGAPATRLRHLADREDADLIIVGSRQRSRGEMMLAGSLSLSLELAREAAQSVLVVPLSAPILMEYFPSIERMLVATDLSPACNLAARRAMAMAPATAQIVLMTVVHPRELPNREFVRDVSDPRFIAGHADWIERSHQALTDLLPDGIAESRVHIEVVEDEDVPEGIRRAANRVDASVICLGTMGHTGLTAIVLGSIAQDVLKIVKRPVMLIPREEL